MEEDLKNLIGPGSRKWISNKDILLFFILLFFSQSDIMYESSFNNLGKAIGVECYKIPDEYTKRRMGRNLLEIAPFVVGANFVVAVLWPTPGYRRSISDDVAKNNDEKMISSDDFVIQFLNNPWL